MPQAINWPRHDALVAQGVTSRRVRARRLGIAESTLRQAEQRRPPEGRATPALTAPVMPDLTQQLQDLEARLKAYIDQRLVEVLWPTRLSEVPQVPKVPRRLSAIPRGTLVSEYPKDPKKDTRLNLHIPAGEVWALKAVAAALGLDPSRLIRHLLETFQATIEGKEALQQALATAGMALEAGEGRDGSEERPRS